MRLFDKLKRKNLPPIKGSMKKLRFICAIVFVLALALPQIAYGNMSEPKQSDIGSAVTFEKNDEISVLSETLDIRVDGSRADISATYQMKNTTEEIVSTPSMFLSPNIENSGVKVTVNGRDTAFTVESYILQYDTEVKTEDWQYVILASDTPAGLDEGKTVDTITFAMDFAPREEYEVVVSYGYTLGGYPDFDFDAKRGEIKYFLRPAAMWKDFSGLTINLFLDEDMPIIKSSNLEFEKVEKRTYQYVSDTLPEEELRIVIDENWFQNIFSTLRSPYLAMTLQLCSPLLILIGIVVVLVIWRAVKRKRGN